MTRTLTTFLAIGAAFPAAAASFGEADRNGDGVLTVFEVQEVWPEVTTEGFLYLDSDGDGLLSEREVAAGREKGMLSRAD
ncbi:MAG: hypothetical protein CML50_11695 [Rhodobacteraceae bacterium]|jgi:hypothetical protein|uniref:EF-hand domain-containing protein n=1 Tax=Salipiger profundus TaxID=1229727 RepID=A0A1U7D897_9RHOB|nr:MULTISPECIES: hypothetical protein [Salipiger]APX24338.1 hypothetical protein Ga0080559_TMP3542 [Salipiger profundus]MAB06656.1 hypothetical protein [Paracoccaceae bacterium]GFZ96065.1 hypothetical protein GCM10011326_04080 [Salipiger profundus]SFB83434.1 EF hand [Salipiger profundus]